MVRAFCEPVNGWIRVSSPLAERGPGFCPPLYMATNKILCPFGPYDAQVSF